MMKIAQDAGALLMDYYRNGQTRAGLETKLDGEIVTDADRESNSLILSRLTLAFPGIPVLAEESVDTIERLTSTSLFIVDPLDGTNNFVAGLEDFSVSIAYTEGPPGQHMPGLGLVHKPATGETYLAQLGKGAVLRTERGDLKLTVSKGVGWGKARLVCSALREDELTRKLKNTARFWHGRGSSALMVCMIAHNEAEWYAHVATRHLSEYDICAADLILSEAGGDLSDCKGDTIFYNKPDITLENGVVTSADSIIHARALRTVALIKNCI